MNSRQNFFSFFDKLPPEMTLKICRKLSLDSVVQLASTSHTLNLFANDNLMWYRRFRSETENKGICYDNQVCYQAWCRNPSLFKFYTLAKHLRSLPQLNRLSHEQRFLQMFLKFTQSPPKQFIHLMEEFLIGALLVESSMIACNHLPNCLSAELSWLTSSHRTNTIKECIDKFLAFDVNETIQKLEALSFYKSIIESLMSTGNTVYVLPETLVTHIEATYAFYYEQYNQPQYLRRECPPGC